MRTLKFKNNNWLFVLILIMTMFTTTIFGRQPLEIAHQVADKIIRESAFEFELIRQRQEQGLHVIDFKSTFGKQATGIGYALSYISCNEETETLIGISSKNKMDVRVNGQMVYEQEQRSDFQLQEISYNRFVFTDTFRVQLNKGLNRILIKSYAGKNEWTVFLRAITPEGDENTNVSFSIKSIAPDVQSEWLLCGPFDSEYNLPEKEFKWYYQQKDRMYSWQPPKQNALLSLVIPVTNSFQRDSYLEWHYANGETMLGMLYLAEAANEIKYADFVRKFCDFTLEHLERFRYEYNDLNAFRCINHRFFRRTMLDDTGGPTQPFIELLLKSENADYRNVVGQMADYVSNEQVRLDDDTFCRPEPEPYTIWADDLFMSVPFLLRWAKITGDRKYYDDAAHQIVRFYHYLFDEEKGLMKHGWFSRTGETSVAFWGRANGWVVWAMSEALLHLPKDHSEFERIRSLFGKHIRGLAKYQDESGMWHQVLDHPNSYEETSCTAMYVAGMARGVLNNWIDDKYRDNALKGWRALQQVIAADGTVHGICRGTGIGDSFEFYYNRQTFDHDPRGLGAMLMAGVEISKLQNVE